MVISKCKGTGCSKKETCERYTIPEAIRHQPWLFMKVAIPDVDKCGYYWDNRPATVDQS